jgi:hypothetical protein
VSAPQSRSIASSLPETMRCTSLLMSTALTAPLWPVNGLPTGLPVSASGAWVVRGERGEQWPAPPAQFAQRYQGPVK